MGRAEHAAGQEKLRTVFERGVSGLLLRAGFRVRRFGAEVVDLRNRTADPIEAIHIGDGRQPVVSVPLERCLILRSNAFRCSTEVGNPFIDTLVEYGSGGEGDYAASVLRRFYDAWRPRNAAEVLGLDETEHPTLAGARPLRYVLPWEGHDPEATEAHRERSIREIGARVAVPLSARDGWKAWGPCSREMGEAEFFRLTDVYDSIRSRGMLRSDAPDGDIGGVVLGAGREWRILVGPGHHRAAALAALGETVAPVRLRLAVVRRDEAFRWPGVRAGVFTEKAALEVFDRMYAGRQPRGCPGLPSARSFAVLRDAS